MFDINTSNSKPKNVYEYINETPVVPHLENVSISDLEKQFEEKFNARVREMDYQKLQTEYQELKIYVGELEKDLGDAVEANTQMKEKIKSLQSMENYAGLAGIFLGKMGLKDKVSDILSGFLGGDEKKDDETSTHIDDSSGIIEDFCIPNPQPAPEAATETEIKTETESESVPISEPQPKNDFIDLINSYLLRMDKPTLGILLVIISKIETNDTLAQQILEMMYKNNSKASGKAQKSIRKSETKNYFSAIYSVLCRKLETFRKILEKFRCNLRKS
jgi:hypothetical protein